MAARTAGGRHTLPDDELILARFYTHHDATTGELVGTDDSNTILWYVPSRHQALTVTLDGEMALVFDIGKDGQSSAVNAYSGGELVKTAIAAAQS